MIEAPRVSQSKPVVFNTLPELLSFLSQEKQQIVRPAAFPMPCMQGNHDFPIGNLKKISIRFPLDFLAGKLKNTSSDSSKQGDLEVNGHRC